MARKVRRCMLAAIVLERQSVLGCPPSAHQIFGEKAIQALDPLHEASHPADFSIRSMPWKPAKGDGEIGQMVPRELSVIVPVFREGESLTHAVDRIVKCIELATRNFELLLIDDGSEDVTWTIICALSVQHPQVRGLRLNRNYGKDAAISAGLKHCAGEAAVVMDADLQHPPELIPEFLQLWKQGYHVVEGIKRDRNDEPFLRRQCSRIFNYVARVSTGLNLQNSSDFKLISREVIDAWGGMHESRIFFRGMVEWLGFRKIQVPFDVAPSIRNQSTFPVLKLIAMSAKAIISYSSAPLRIAHVTSLAFTGFGVALGIEALYLRFTHKAVDGFTTVIVLQLILGGLTLGILSVISEYLAAIYEEVKARPRFLISETVGPAVKSGDAMEHETYPRRQ